MKYENTIKELLRKRGFESETEMEEFLNPSLDSFHNPFLLKNMDKAVERINTAINNKEKIVIYGDYDCDGISAVSVLYLFFKSKGLMVQGFIPSRHTDGYGLSEETVYRIKEEFNPTLVITVDTGISAWKEIELFNSLGVDTIVTDHHEPPEKLPAGIVIDPKILDQDYPFSGLSGAGVAFKLVQALSGLDTALEYADIVAISTVGDIVPLLDENRMIVKLGLEKINSKHSRPSIGYLKSKLKLGYVSSTDISFKIVPRLNACGRISSAEKCFLFMVSENGNELEKLFLKIEEDNSERLLLSANTFEKIDKTLATIDLNKEPAVFILDEDINLGIIGIVASRLVNIINRPVFIFTKDESGQLKASVRSVEGIDIFKILDSHRELMVDVGGHSMAGGLTILPENYNALKEAVRKDLQGVDPELFKSKKQEEYDLEISEKDINIDFAMELESLEPFGFQNPQPLFKLCTKSTNYMPLKSLKHFKIGLNGKKEIMSFFGDNLVPYFKTTAEKETIITLEVDRYFSTPRPKAMLKYLSCKNYKFNDEKSFSKAKDIFYLNGLEKREEKKNPENFKYLPFGVAVITDSYEDAVYMQKKTGYKIVLDVEDSGESVIIYNPYRTVGDKLFQMYKSVEVRSSSIFAEYLRSRGLLVLDSSTRNSVELKLTREVFKQAYVALTKELKVVGNNFFEIVDKLADKTKFEPVMIVSVFLIGHELGFYNISQSESGVEILVNTNSKKRNLEESSLYRKLS